MEQWNSNFLLSGFSDEISPDFGRQMEVLKKLNLEYMEIRGVDGRGIDTYSAAEAGEIRKRLDDRGIRISSLASPVGKVEITEAFSGHLEHFKHVTELAHILGAPCIRIFSFFMPKGEKPERYRDEVFRRLEAFISCPELGELTLLHENEKDIYGDTADRCRELMETFYGSHFKAVFDFANFIQCGQNPREAFELLKDYVAYVHIKDAAADTGVITTAGTGDGRIPEILTELRKGGYQGFLSLEPHLTEFAGLGNLEREGASLKGMRTMSGEEAFVKAHQALMKILKEMR